VPGAGGQEIQAHAAVAAPHPRGIQPMPAQLAADRRAQRVVGDHADHRHVMAEVRQRDADVGLGATAMHLQRRGLQQQLVAGGAEPQQQLAETDNTGGTHRDSCRGLHGRE